MEALSLLGWDPPNGVGMEAAFTGGTLKETSKTKRKNEDNKNLGGVWKFFYFRLYLEDFHFRRIFCRWVETV